MGRKFTAVVFSLGCLHASSALALGLGELKLESFLNEPLKASVDLLNTGGLHQDEIRIHLGTREDFKKLGLDRAFFLTSIEFEVVIDDNGRALIMLSTDAPVLEPYLDFIVEARWPSGRLLREYTVLVDPPVYSDATPVVSASERVEELEGIPAPGKKKEVATSTGTKVDVRKSDLGPGEMPQRDFNAATADSPAPGSRYMIKRDDTLWAIAAGGKPDGASVHQTMLDIQRLNPDAFINNNINRVKAGYIVYLPSANDISSADMVAALAEVREQNAAWREGRDAELAASRGPSLRISADADEEPVTTDEDVSSAVEREPGAVALAEQDALEDLADLENAGAGDLAAMEGRVETLQRIVDLKDDQIAALQAALAKAEGDVVSEAEQAESMSEAGELPLSAADDLSDQAAEEFADEEAIGEQDSELSGAPTLQEEAAAEPATTEKTAAKKAPTPSAPVADSSGGIMDYIWYLVGAAVLALVGFFFARRRAADMEDADAVMPEEDIFSEVKLGEHNLDVKEEPAINLEAEMAAAAPVATTRGYGERKHDAYASDVEAADALAEADIYIAYGRHQQAIDLLNNALSNESSNPVYRLKLMEIHTELNNREEASEQLHQLRSTGDENSVARAEELMASFDSGETATASVAPEESAGEDPDAERADGPGLAPNPLDLADDAGAELEDIEFSGLEIEESAEEVLTKSDDLDLSGDFTGQDTGEDDEDIVIAADANGMSTKLDLARAYLDMGDDDGARQILEEVIADGSDELKVEAQSLLDRIG